MSALLLPLLCLWAVDPAAALQLPIFPFSTADRPAEIGIVKAQSGDQILEHDLSCNNKATWQLWSNESDQANGGKPLLVNRDVIVGCNHDQSLSGSVVAATGTSCMTAVSCTKGKCADKIADTSKDNYAFLDPQCFVKITNNNKLQSRWANHEKTIRDLREKNPAGPAVTTADIYMAVPILDPNTPAGGIDSTTKKFLAHRWWNGLMADRNRKTDFSCKDGCRYGTHMQVQYGRKESAMHIFLQPHCDWFTVCTSWRKSAGLCSPQSTVNVMLRNGFVSFDAKRDQMPTRLIRQSEGKTGIGRVDFTILSATTVGHSHTHVAVTTMFRQRVLGPTNGGDLMMISFSHPDCLHPEFGLRAQTSEVTVVILKPDPDEYTKNVTTKNPTTVGNIITNPVTNTVGGVEIPNVTMPVTASTVQDVTASATTMETPLPPQTAHYQGPVVVKSEDTKAVFEGHATWAIFYGWLIGSFLAMATMAPIMYFCRRTIYNDWYRGVFKRYGCDASGTTGGITAASFNNTTDNSMMTLQSQMDTSTMTQTTGTSTAATSIASSVNSTASSTPPETQTVTM